MTEHELARQAVALQGANHLIPLRPAGDIDDLTLRHAYLQWLDAERLSLAHELDYVAPDGCLWIPATSSDVNRAGSRDDAYARLPSSRAAAVLTAAGVFGVEGES